LAASSEQAASASTGEKRDPFVPLVKDGQILSLLSKTPRVSSVPLTLGGILWDPAGQSIALINETEVRVGDTIYDYRVAEIRQDAVVLVQGDQSVVLQLLFDDAAKPPKRTP